MTTFTLDTFYNSSAWRNFRQIVIQERADKETGVVYCEYCGKPIVGSGQIVCHHIEELNEFNVNNPKISLNSDNIALVHINCHNNIHAKFINCEKTVWLLYGPPTSYYDYLENNVGINDIVVCMDWIYKALNPQNPLFPKTRGVKNTAFKIESCIKDYIKTRLRCNFSNAFICGGYPTVRDRETVCKELGISDSHILFFDITMQEAIENAKKYKAPKSYERYIHDWFEDYEEG